MEPFQQLVDWVLPAGALEWFDLTDTQGTPTELRVVLTEKNNPPITPELQNRQVESKGFKDITIRPVA
jgi:hypothetical protein